MEEAGAGTGKSTSSCLEHPIGALLKVLPSFHAGSGSASPMWDMENLLRRIVEGAARLPRGIGQCLIDVGHGELASLWKVLPSFGLSQGLS